MGVHVLIPQQDNGAGGPGRQTDRVIGTETPLGEPRVQKHSGRTTVYGTASLQGGRWLVSGNPDLGGFLQFPGPAAVAHGAPAVGANSVAPAEHLLCTCDSGTSTSGWPKGQLVFSVK